MIPRKNPKTPTDTKDFTDDHVKKEISRADDKNTKDLTDDRGMISQGGFHTEKSVKVITDSQTQSVSWHPDSLGFVYEKIQAYRLYYRFYDLYFYDLKSEKSVRLTHGARAHQSCFVPNGKTLYFLQNKASAKNLVAMDWETKTQTVLYQGTVGDDLRSLSLS